MTTEIKTTSRTVLRRMLRDCDRKLYMWDQRWKHHAEWFGGPRITHFNGISVASIRALDARRREIRKRLKERRDG